MKDYTEDIIVDDNTFRLVLDETLTREFCLINKYAGIIEIIVHPLIIKIFNTDDVINFGAWKFLESCGTPVDNLEEFIYRKFVPETFVAMIAISCNFSDMLLVMEAVDRIHNSSEVIRENKYNLVNSQKIDICKLMMSANVQQDAEKLSLPSWGSKIFISDKN